MGRFEQTFLQPGRYHVGGGRFRDFTAQEIASYVNGTKELLAAGHSVPLIFEHAAPGSDEGSPRDTKAAQVKHGAGWLEGVNLGNDGSALHVLDVTDPDAFKKLSDGSIRFTSPELRPTWTDGKGRVFKNIISHVALTHKPRNPDQSKLQPVQEPALQFSLADLEPIQMSDNADDKDPIDKATDNETPADATENPDMPTPGAASEEQKQLESCIAFLKTIGVALPANTDASNFMDRLQTGLMTLAESKSKAESDAAADEDEADEAPLIEEKPPIQQFSLSDVEGDKFTNKLLAKVIKAEHGHCKSRLESLVAKNNISPALRDSLLGKSDVLQFSADGEYVPSWTLPEMVAVLESCTHPGQGLEVEQFSAEATEEQHPGGDAFLQGNAPLTPAQAKALVDQQVANGIKIS